MDKWRRERKIFNDIQVAKSKIRHLNELLLEIRNEIKKANDIIKKAAEDFEKLKED